ncbi:MAG TPA: hypothetical protein VHA52_04215, partial [Candidatus Babeliaceae bacterium]|nr:hypothetical protein [Candidatus Babeliaceae bacterium]
MNRKVWFIGTNYSALLLCLTIQAEEPAKSPSVSVTTTVTPIAKTVEQAPVSAQTLSSALSNQTPTVTKQPSASPVTTVTPVQAATQITTIAQPAISQATKVPSTSSGIVAPSIPGSATPVVSSANVVAPAPMQTSKPAQVTVTAAPTPIQPTVQAKPVLQAVATAPQAQKQQTPAQQKLAQPAMPVVSTKSPDKRMQAAQARKKTLESVLREQPRTLEKSKPARKKRSSKPKEKLPDNVIEFSFDNTNLIDVINKVAEAQKLNV